VVIARRNDYTAGLFNGQRGVITHVDPDRGTATLRINDRDIMVGRRYLQAGNLDHGYALTIHQAQGLTTGRALVLGNDSLYRESGYVALSRGRVRNDLHLAHWSDNLDPLATGVTHATNRRPSPPGPNRGPDRDLATVPGANDGPRPAHQEPKTSSQHRSLRHSIWSRHTKGAPLPALRSQMWWPPLIRVLQQAFRSTPR
jgi:hypothetical protein